MHFLSGDIDTQMHTLLSGYLVLTVMFLGDSVDDSSSLCAGQVPVHGL